MATYVYKYPFLPSLQTPLIRHGAISEEMWTQNPSQYNSSGSAGTRNETLSTSALLEQSTMVCILSHDSGNSWCFTVCFFLLLYIYI